MTYRHQEDSGTFLRNLPEITLCLRDIQTIQDRKRPQGYVSTILHGVASGLMLCVFVFMILNWLSIGAQPINDG